MKTYNLRTPFEVSKTPLCEYPRPQFARDSYFSLNGKWNYAICKMHEKFKDYNGEILVPFSPECLLSGVEPKHILQPDETLFYMKQFVLPNRFLKARTFINFGAVDYKCIVIINGKEVGKHKGGYTPFSLEITREIKDGENVIEVLVNDPSDTGYQQRGKQRFKHGGIWYTPQSGIWQSVWLESVDETYLKDMTIIPDIDNDQVNLKLDVVGEAEVELTVYDQNKILINEKYTNQDITFKFSGYECWSPENPKLYQFQIKVGTDVVNSYFGMRKFGIMRDEKGFMRLALNNKPYFHTGVLDQGYWSDGMLTPPSNAALEYDVKLVKSLGFNMIRKHIKIEPMLWYYYCDKEGILVWQDMVSGGSKYNFLTIGVLPFIGIHLKDNNYKWFSRENEKGRLEYINDMTDTVKALKNCVSLAMWVPFNEGWGQFDSVTVTSDIQALDCTRTVDSVSGWHDQGKSTSDFKSLHIYFKPVKIPKDDRCIILSEFGGYSLAVDNHDFSDKKFGYKIFDTNKKLIESVKKLYEKQVIPNISKGLSASVYTQVSDVEQEINGLVTYDRKVVKFSQKEMKELNSKLHL